MAALLAETRRWSRGTPYECRAAAAALCEPALLKREEDVGDVLAILDAITASLARSTDRGSEDVRTLRQGLAYCWSVAVAAAPDLRRPFMERWMNDDDPDIRWVMRQNLSKKRLAAAGSDWVAAWQATWSGSRSRHRARA